MSEDISKESESSDERPRLKIEDTVPIRTVGLETDRERRNFTDLPPQNYVHVWWARRPTPATRLAVLASVLPDSVDDDTLLRWMGIDPKNKPPERSIAEHVRISDATKDQRDGAVYEHYGYRKIWKRSPEKEIINEIHDQSKQVWGGELPTVLDATAGGGSIPFESVRYEFPTVANELNPVASVILKAVLEYPRVDGDLSSDIKKWGDKINTIASSELDDYFHSEKPDEVPVNLLWAHTVTCPDCGLNVPLAPNWWLDKDGANKGTAVRPIIPDDGDDISFSTVRLPEQITKSEYNPSTGTVSYGKATCLRCGVVIDGDEVKRQGQNRQMGMQLYAIEYNDSRNNNRGNFRAPTEGDKEAYQRAVQKVANDPELSTTLGEDRYLGPADRSANYGVTKWRDAFSPRQLLTHHTYWEAFEKIKPEVREQYDEDESDAILTFLAIAADKALDYNNRMSAWDPTIPKLAHSFEKHDFAFKWSFAESNLCASGLGYEWVLDNTLEAYSDLYDLSGSSDAPTKIIQGDAASLPLDSESIEAIVLDPPYYDNVMYAELSDFFYVWLKKYLDDVHPEFFTQELTDKHTEAVANTSQFDDVAVDGKSKGDLAKEDYENKMTGIFDEMHRVLDANGVFTMMFTHKKTEAWDTLTSALIEAGFAVKATHPVSTENPDSLHQRGKNSAESTILLVSEKRDQSDNSFTLWDDIRRRTREAARTKARELDEREIEFTKVDMILASFGPTLRVFTESYPVVDDEGGEIRPQRALDEARSAVSEYLIDQYLNEGIRNVDPKTEWYILSWLVFEAERFPYDEARRLAIGLGENLDELKKDNRMWRKRSGDVLLRPHQDRVQDINKKPENRSNKKPVNPEDLSFAIALDKVHAALHVYSSLGATEAWNWMNDRNCGSDPTFKSTLEGLLRVLPHDHSDWELSRDLAAGDTGDLLDLDLSPSIFESKESDGSPSQNNISDYT